MGEGNSGDPLRIRMSVLKSRCDKARKKDQTIKLMQSWTSKPRID